MAEARKRKRKLAPGPRRPPGPKTIRGNTKKCNCELHNGEFIPLDKFWVFKKGKRKGLPMSRCKEGLMLQQGRNPGTSGYVPLSRFKFVFRELESRIGRVETCRRAGISINFWHRMDRGITRNVQKATVIRLISVLREAREADEVRHKDSIRHGAAARGRQERVPTTRKDFNISHGDSDNDAKKDYRKRNPEYEIKKAQKKKEKLVAKRGY